MAARPSLALLAAGNQVAQIRAMLLREPGLARTEVGLNGARPLHVAAGKGHVDVVEALVAAGADVDAADRRGLTALVQAAMNGRVGAVEALVGAGAAVDGTRDGRPLLDAARNGHSLVVDALLRAGADPNATDGRGQTALHWAATFGFDRVILRLVHAGADTEARAARSGRTALACAAQQGWVVAVDALVGAGARPDTADLDGAYDAESRGRSAERIRQWTDGAHPLQRARAELERALLAVGDAFPVALARFCGEYVHRGPRP